jgi:hypothetical protein
VPRYMKPGRVRIAAAWRDTLSRLGRAWGYMRWMPACFTTNAYFFSSDSK